jgi:DNA-binding response OmpR family regulator
MKRVLIIEDEPAILKGLEKSLTEEHYQVLSATDGEKGYQLAKKENVDIIILDLMLPGKNGQEVCRDLRKDGINTPILMLTSKKQEIDKVVGFESGADDYVTKPFSIRELHARVKALLRRGTELKKEIEEFSFGEVEIDFKKQEAFKKKKLLRLSAKEFEILKYFVIHQGEVISRTKLLDDVWGFEFAPTTRSVDNYILSIRKQIEDNPSKPRHLLTIHTSGYKFVK